MHTVDDFFNQPIVRFDPVIGNVSNVRVDNTSFSFQFGLNNQMVSVLNAEKPDWLRDGVRVEIDFGQKTISLGYACFGIAADKAGGVLEAAPIATWMVGKTLQEIKP